MSVRFAPAIVNDALGGAVFLPVLRVGNRGLTIQRTRQMRNDTLALPGARGSLLLEQVEGETLIDVSGVVVGFESAPYNLSRVSRDGALARVAEIEAATSGVFAFYHYTTQAWTTCVLEQAPLTWDGRQDWWLNYSLRIRALDPVPDLTVSLSAASPYDNLVVNNPAAGEGSSIPVVTKAFESFSVMFPKLAAATVAGEEYRIPLPSPGQTWQVTRLAILGVSGAMGSGTTTVRLATAGVGGGGQAMDVSIDETETRAETTSGFSVAGGNTLHCFLTAGGVHSDVQVLVQYEAA